MSQSHENCEQFFSQDASSSNKLTRQRSDGQADQGGQEVVVEGPGVDLMNKFWP
jgi:hypothetical protein